MSVPCESLCVICSSSSNVWVVTVLRGTRVLWQLVSIAAGRREESRSSERAELLLFLERYSVVLVFELWTKQGKHASSSRICRQHHLDGTAKNFFPKLGFGSTQQFMWQISLASRVYLRWPCSRVNYGQDSKSLLAKVWPRAAAISSLLLFLDHPVPAHRHTHTHAHSQALAGALLWPPVSRVPGKRWLRVPGLDRLKTRLVFMPLREPGRIALMHIHQSLSNGAQNTVCDSFAVEP